MSYLKKPWLKYYPPNIPYEVEIPEIPVYRLIDEVIRRFGEKVSMIYYGNKIRYRELGNYINKMASVLYNLGIRKNDVVAIYLPNCPQFTICYYAIQKIGAIPMAVNFLYSQREIRHQLEDSRARCMIMIDLLYNKMKPLIDDLKIDKLILTDISYYMPYIKKKLSILLGKMPKAKLPKDEPVYFFEKLNKNEKKINYPEANVNVKEDIATLSYTAGTTGMPKGAPLTHFNVVANLVQTVSFSGDVFDSKDTEYLLAYLPFFHVYGQIVIMTGGLWKGKTLIVTLRPNFKELLKNIEKYKINLFFGVPASYSILLKYIRENKYDLSSLKICACGSDKVSQELAEEFKKLTGVDIVEGYGLTETGGGVLGVPIGGKLKRGSLGIPLPNTLVAIANIDKDEFVPVGEIGEIIVHGPQVIKHYWNDGKKYKKAFAKIAGKMWLRTGDIGYMDADGYFYFIERKKDIIKYKGYTIFPGEIEKVIKENNMIKDAAVIGINNPMYGQIIKAYIVVKDEYKGKVSKKDIIKWCKDKIAYYKIPKEIEFIDELPKNIIGKVLRRQLRGETNA